MSDYLRLDRNDPQRVEAWRQENNVKPVRVGSRLLRSFYRQLFEDDLFHGDLHPGNIILLRNSRIALIDLGTLGNLEKRFVEIYKLQAKAFSERDYSKAADFYLLLCDSIPGMDIEAFRTETVEVYRNWEARTHLQGLTFLEKSITGGVATEASEIARKYKVNPTWQLLRVARSLATLDANLNSLLGTTNPNRIIRKYFRQARRREFKRFQKGGVRGIASLIGNSAIEAMVSGRFIADSLRQEAIRFQGVQQKLHHFLAVLFRLFRWGLIIGGIVLFYDFLHLHHFNLVGWLHPHLGAFGGIAETIGLYPYEFGVAAIVGVFILIIVTGRLIKSFSQATVRLPDGRLDT
jgi:ubiquinone biosynthesis protein